MFVVMATKNDIADFERAFQWTTEEVVAWLASPKVNLAHVGPYFEQQGITGADLVLLDKADLREMGIGVGPRLRLLRALANFKTSQMLAVKNKVLWEGRQWYLCPLFVLFPTRYVLSSSALTVYKGQCCGSYTERIDLSAIEDVGLTQQCLNGTLMISSSDSTMPLLHMKLSKAEATATYKQVKDAVEVDQQRMAGRY